MWQSSQETADLVTFTEEILHGKLRFLFSGGDLIPSLRGIDTFKVKITVSDINNIICSIRVKNLDELINLLRAGVRLVCNKVGVIANKR